MCEVFLRHPVDGFLMETGLCGMFEAHEFDSDEVFSTFLGVLVDKCCGFFDAADTTAIFTEYVDLVAFNVSLVHEVGMDREEYLYA